MSKDVCSELTETVESVDFYSDINEGIGDDVEIYTEPELPVIDPNEVSLAETETFNFIEQVRQKSQVESPISGINSESPDIEAIIDFVTESTFTPFTTAVEDTPVEPGNLPHFSNIEEGLETVTPESSSDIEISSILGTSSSYTLHDEDVSDTSDIDMPVMFPEPEKFVRHFISGAEHSSLQSSHRQEVNTNATSLGPELPGPSSIRFDQEVEGLTETEMVKKELQLAIQYKRLTRGESELVLEETQPKKYEVSINNCVC